MRGPQVGAFAPLVVLVLGFAAGRLQARASGQATLPDSPAGKGLAGWLKAYNSGRVEVVREFVASRYARKGADRKDSDERRVEVFNRVYGANGPLELVRVEKETRLEIAALTHAPLAESWLRLTARVEASAPHALLRVAIEPADEPRPNCTGKLDDQEIARQLDAYLDRLAGADLFSGAVLFARNGKPIYGKAYGLASQAYKVPNRLDTKFNLGSMNKMFTAVAIAQLARQGKLSFTDSLARHLPDYPNKEAARKVTLHQLLTHTSGVPDYFNDKFNEGSRERYRTIEDFLTLFADKPLTMEPGKEFRYSNGGFLVLGAVVETVSGQDYFDYVREHIYQPAGMIHTDAYEMDHDTPNLAVGYTRVVPRSGKLGSAKKNNLFLHVVKGGPAGGGFSTVEDLHRFDRALRSHRLLDAGHTDLVLEGKVQPDPREPSEKYAYGFMDVHYRGTRIVGHDGGFPGINSVLDMYPDRGYMVAVMANYDPLAAHLVAHKMRRLITQE